MLYVLVESKPLVGLQLSPLAPTLQQVVVQEEGTAPQPLFMLLGALARYEDAFPRTKQRRPDAIEDRDSPALALHRAGITAAAVGWLVGGARGREMRKWTPYRQLCAWRVAEGLARHVRPAAVKLVEGGVAVEVKAELLQHLRGDMEDQVEAAYRHSHPWPPIALPSPPTHLPMGP